MMSKKISINIKKRTLKRLRRIAKSISGISEVPITLDKVINHLIDNCDELHQIGSHDIESDRKEFLKLLDQKVFGGKPEDYKEYAYNDLI